MNHLITNELGIKKHGIISFVGAGGKTTLMFRIAKELANTDDRILITTTTKIFPPDKRTPYPLVLANSKENFSHQIQESFRKSSLIIAASNHCTKTNKLIGFDPDFVDELWQSGQFDWILAEADGSARKSIKAPGDHEPIIPRKTSYLIGLIGLSALGKPVSEQYVHRVDKFLDITQLFAGEYIDVEAISALIRHKSGLFKNRPGHAVTIAFLNQADTLPSLDTVTFLATQLGQYRSDIPDLVVIGQAEKTPAIVKKYSKNPSQEQN